MTDALRQQALPGSEPVAVGVSAEVGFYGKLPSHGDFLRRRVPDAFVAVWDAWLQECLAASRAALGDRWLDIYLTSPAWRFACSPGAAGPLQIGGLMVPSVDRVGRYFPLTVAAELPGLSSVLAAATEAESFFDRAERLVLDTLAAEPLDFEAFDDAVARLGAELQERPQSRVILGAASTDVLEDPRDGCWNLPLASSSQLAPAFLQLLSHRLAALYEPLVLWWTEGSVSIQPTCLMTRGLPHPDTFASLLDGSWSERRWRTVPVHVEVGAGDIVDPLQADVSSIQYRSAGATDVGRVRSVNQDAFLERGEVGLWVVADGLGGHSNGDVASRMVCDAFADFLPDSTFAEGVISARDRLQHVNDYLIHVAERSNNTVLSGTTVVALMTRGAHCVVLWAGDSRVYRWRDGRLEQVTRDHSVAEAEGGESTAITRAVGGEPTLLLDEYEDSVLPGDRFLLCSDGLTRAVPEAQIETWLGHEDIRSSVDGLIQATLAAGAPDNVTVLVVEAF
jgi:type VI secretion system ImpM family protein